MVRVIGKIVTSLPGVMYAPLHYRLLEHSKTSAPQKCIGNFHERMALFTAAKKELAYGGFPTF